MHQDAPYPVTVNVANFQVPNDLHATTATIRPNEGFSMSGHLVSSGGGTVTVSSGHVARFHGSP